jgi:hypothetical protein
MQWKKQSNKYYYKKITHIKLWHSDTKNEIIIIIIIIIPKRTTLSSFTDFFFFACPFSSVAFSVKRLQPLMRWCARLLLHLLFLPVSQNVRTHFHGHRKPETFSVPSRNLRDTGRELFETHKTGSVSGKSGQMRSLCVPIHERGLFTKTFHGLVPISLEKQRTKKTGGLPTLETITGEYSRVSPSL